MRIAVVHSFYSESTPSGENQVVRHQVEILREAGHEVALVRVDTDSVIRAPLFRTRAALSTLTTLGRNPLSEIRSFKADIVHVHNLFPNFGSSWLSKCQVPFVATLHNYRPMCANGLLYRDGEGCFDCLHGSSIPALIHRCYKDSLLATLPLAVRMELGSSGNPLLKHARRLICLNKEAADLYADFGVAPSRIEVLPNPVGGLLGPQVDVDSNGRWLYVGRLSAEKGLVELAVEWPDEVTLDVIGDGQLSLQLRESTPWNFLGVLPNATVRNLLSEYQGLIFPSRCLEMQPTAVIEAFQAGVPVVALSGNAGAKLITAHGGGVVYEVGNLSRALRLASDQRLSLGKQGQRTYAHHFSVDTWLNKILGLYVAALED